MASGRRKVKRSPVCRVARVDMSARPEQLRNGGQVTYRCSAMEGAELPAIALRRNICTSPDKCTHDLDVL